MKDHVITSRIGPAVAAADATAPLTIQQVDAGDTSGGVEGAGEPKPQLKHIALDAGESGRIEVAACGWFDSVREKLGRAPDGGRKAAAASGVQASLGILPQ